MPVLDKHHKHYMSFAVLQKLEIISECQLTAEYHIFTMLQHRDVTKDTQYTFNTVNSENIYGSPVRK